jgi:predicted peptidase
MSYPVIVSLHGGGGRGTDNLKQLRIWNYVLAEQQRRTDYPACILAPQSTGMWNTIHLQNIKDIIKDIPIWAFHGNQDKVCPIDRDQKIFAEMKEIGGNMKFTTWDGDGHGVAAKMITGSDNGSTQYSSDRCDPEPEFLKWLFKQKLSNHN